MPILLFNLELTKDELTVIWAGLVILKSKPVRHKDAERRRLDAAAKKALSKVERLMEGR